MGEVVEADGGAQASLVAGGQDGAVPVEGGLVVDALGRLAAGPLHRQAEGVAAGGHRPVEVVLVAVPERQGDARRLHPPDCSHSNQSLAGSPGPLSPPSVWKADVATPKRNPAGRTSGGGSGTQPG